MENNYSNNRGEKEVKFSDSMTNAPRQQEGQSSLVLSLLFITGLNFFFLLLYLYSKTILAIIFLLRGFHSIYGFYFIKFHPEKCDPSALEFQRKRKTIIFNLAKMVILLSFALGLLLYQKNIVVISCIGAIILCLFAFFINNRVDKNMKDKIISFFSLIDILFYSYIIYDFLNQ